MQNKKKSVVNFDNFNSRNAVTSRTSNSKISI